MSEARSSALPSLPDMTAAMERLARYPIGGVVALLVFLTAVINAYSYSMIVTVPLVQSDTWFFLDGFLGHFIEHGFTFTDLFWQANPNDTNLPLQKAILFFHTHFYGMDFRVEGLFGIGAAILMVVVLARAAAARPFRDWRSREVWLLAGLALTQLSLNSTNVFTWSLVTLWFVSTLVASLYMWHVHYRERATIGLAFMTFLLGMLLDEVSFPVMAAVAASLLLLPRCREPGELRRFATYAGAGLIASRIAYWALTRAAMGGNAGEAAAVRSWAAFFSPGLWKAALLPLSDSVVWSANLATWFKDQAPAYGLGIALIMALAHLWFWWRALSTSREAPADARRLTLFASSLMMFFYALVAGIVMQRVFWYGFDYLHQPRYVLFYQLNLAALGLMFYRDYRFGGIAESARRVPVKALVVAAFACFSLLQFRLSTLAWEQQKYLSVYLENTAFTMARLAAHPEGNFPCSDIMTVCKFEPWRRRKVLNLLVRYRLNLFSPDFQAFHRLHTAPLPPPKQEN